MDRQQPYRPSEQNKRRSPLHFTRSAPLDGGGRRHKASGPSAPTVLMVEDHDDTACLVRFILEGKGYAVKHAPDGFNAKRLTEATDPPDLILLDITLPSLSGLDVLRAVRSTPEWQRIPVIMLTANSNPEAMTEAANLGATEYLKKPFSPERLLQVIQSLLPVSNVHSTAEQTQP